MTERLEGEETFSTIRDYLVKPWLDGGGGLQAIPKGTLMTSLARRFLAPAHVPGRCRGLCGPQPRGGVGPLHRVGSGDVPAYESDGVTVVDAMLAQWLPLRRCDAGAGRAFDPTAESTSAVVVAGGREVTMGEKNGRPERAFPGRSDAWFVVTMAAVAGGLSVGYVACFLGARPSSPWRWLALLPVAVLVALAAPPVCSNRVELWADRLVVVHAGTRTTIPHPHVRGVRLKLLTMSATSE